MPSNRNLREDIIQDFGSSVHSGKDFLSGGAFSSQERLSILLLNYFNSYDFESSGKAGRGRIPSLQFEDISNLTHVGRCLRAHRCAGVSKRNIPSFFQDQGIGSTRCPAQPKEIQEGWGNVVISSNPAGKLCARSLVLIQPSIFGIPGSLLPGPAVSLWRALRGGGGGVIKTHRQGYALACRKHSAPHPPSHSQTRC